MVDLDGVLRHRDPLEQEACEHVHGLPSGSIAEVAFAPRLLGRAIRGDISDEQWRAQTKAALSQRHPDADVEGAIAVWTASTGHIDQAVSRLLGSVRGQATICLVTNGTSRLAMDLAALSFNDQLDYVFNSADLGHSKPSREFYLAASRLCGVPPSRCLFVDDNALNADGAMQAGMSGHLYLDVDRLKGAVDAWLMETSGEPPGEAVCVTPPRNAARIVCIDEDDNILLLHWRDSLTGRRLWEPPGGKMKPGENDIEAARRELTEETGLPGTAVLDRSINVHRDFEWCGKRYRNVEPFFLAKVGRATPATERALTSNEVETLLGDRWWHWSALLTTEEHIEPFEILRVLQLLAPRGPWAASRMSGAH